MTTTASPPAPRHALAWFVRALLALIVLVVVAVAALLWWLSSSPDGWRTLLSQVPGLTVTQPQGSMIGGPFAAQRITYQRGELSLTADKVAWRDLRWRWRPSDGVWLGIEVDQLGVEQLSIRTGPSTGPIKAPSSLRLPVSLVLKEARIAKLDIDKLPSIIDVQANLSLGADEGRNHRVDALRFTWQKLRATGTGAIGADSPMPVALSVQAASVEGTPLPWSAQATVGGPLQRLAIALDGQTQGQSSASVRATTTLAPFEPWPVQALDATLANLDLSQLLNDGPSSRIDGRMHVDAPSRAQGLSITADLRNGKPARWDQQGLPVTRLRVDANGSVDQPDLITLKAIEVRLHDNAGSVTGAGQWQGEAMTWALQTEDLQPAKLDARVAAMTLSGPLEAKLGGLPTPSAFFAGRAIDANSRQTMTLDANLQGRLATSNLGGGEVAKSPLARVSLQASGSRQGGLLELDVKDLSLSAAGARALTKLELQRNAQQRWSAKGATKLEQFDPLPWFPGAAGSAWRQGGHRFQGDAIANLTWSPAATAQPWFERVRGNASARLQDSRLAGVPLAGEATWSHVARDAKLQARLLAGGNRIELDGVLVDGAPAQNQGTFSIDAARLSELAPIAKLDPRIAEWVPKGGAMQARSRFGGRWPNVTLEGTAEVKELQVAQWRVAKGAATWRAARDVQAPLEVDLDVSDVAEVIGAKAVGNPPGTNVEPRIERVKASLRGTLASHRIEIDGASPIRPPAWAQTLAAERRGTATATRGTTLSLRGTGAWAAAPASADPKARAGQWTLVADDVAVRPRADGAMLPWFAAQGLRASIAFDATGRPIEASADPGQSRMLDARFKWTQARWQRDLGPNSPAAIDLDSQLEPLSMAPLLARWLPGYGWGGDLQIGGRFIVRTTPERFNVDWVIERRGGDLTITDEGVTQALGLSDLRVALSAQDGTWHFTQAAAGSNFGVLVGAQSVRVPPATRWPSTQTPLEGVMSWRVDNLTTLAPWMPPGWRMGGDLSASAALGGRIGAPEYTGEITGSKLALRHVLEGVDVRDGELRVRLRGEDARIERFVLRGGEGELRIEGGATFGESPVLNLTARAEKFQALGRVDRRLIASGQVSAQIKSDELAAKGQLTVDEGLFDLSRRDAPSLDSDVAVNRPEGAASGVASTASGATSTNGAPSSYGQGSTPARRATQRQARLDLQLDLGRNLQLKGRGIDTRLAGTLQITSPANRMSVQGQVRTEGGTYRAYSQNLQIERGLINFNGPVDNPRLDIVAERPNLDIRVGVAIVGTAQNPRVRLFSQPEMSDTDKLSWLMLGRGPDGLGRADTALLQRAALAIWAGEDGDAPSDALLKTIGLDEFSVRQADSGEVRETVIRVGKQLGRRWYIGYERGVNSSTGTWQIIYRIAQRLTVRAQSGSDNSLDAIWTWRWN